MSLETFNYIKDLVPTNPLGSDPKSEGDDHLRGIKQTLQNQFPGFTQGKPITLTEDELNGSSYKKIYPVGAIYLSVNDVDPATLFAGTTWARIATGSFLMSGDPVTNPIGGTGGAASVTLTWDQMPAHGHGYTREAHTQPGYSGIAGGGTQSVSDTTASAGGGQAHENRPPYLSVNMWQRTA